MAVSATGKEGDTDMLEKIKSFVTAYPHWEEGNLLFMDFTDGVPGNGGLFPEGITQVSFREDILGNKEADMQLQVVLYRYGAEEEGDGQWLLRFQSWVAEQSAFGNAPVFGDVPHRERLYAQKGKLAKRRDSGNLYSVMLTAEFTKKYEVNENGEN